MNWTAAQRGRYEVPLRGAGTIQNLNLAKRYFVASAPCSRAFQRMVLANATALIPYFSPALRFNTRAMTLSAAFP